MQVWAQIPPGLRVSPGCSQAADCGFCLTWDLCCSHCWPGWRPCGFKSWGAVSLLVTHWLQVCSPDAKGCPLVLAQGPLIIWQLTSLKPAACYICLVEYNPATRRTGSSIFIDLRVSLKRVGFFQGCMHERSRILELARVCLIWPRNVQLSKVSNPAISDGLPCFMLS